ncbi:GspH/FimT family pseudopilin [Haliea atlantica]
MSPPALPVSGCPAPGAVRRARGFSLIELLVVLLVIVIMTSLATLGMNVGTRERTLEAQLRELSNLARHAQEEAELSGRSYGLLLALDSVDGEPVYQYHWREQRPGGWRRPEIGGELFRPRTLVEGLLLELTLESVPDTPALPAPVAPDATPQVLFQASGEVSAGTLDIYDRESNTLLWRLQWDGLGRWEMLPEGRPEDDSGGGEREIGR